MKADTAKRIRKKNALEAEYFSSEIRYTFTTNVVASFDFNFNELLNALEV